MLILYVMLHLCNVKKDQYVQVHAAADPNACTRLYACRPTQFYRPLGLLVLGLPNSFLHLLGCLKFGFDFTTPFLSIPSVTRLLLLHTFFPRVEK